MRQHTRGSKEERGLVAIRKGEEVPVEAACKCPLDKEDLGVLISRILGPRRLHRPPLAARLEPIGREQKSTVFWCDIGGVPDFALGDPGQRREWDAGENLGRHCA